MIGVVSVVAVAGLCAFFEYVDWLFFPAGAPAWGPIRLIGNWLNKRAARNDPTPGEMQYLLRLVELWCRQRDLFWISRNVKLAECNVGRLDYEFWNYVADGESARVDPEIGGYVNAPCKHGALDCADTYLTTCPSLVAHCRKIRDNRPPNWKKIIRQLRGGFLASGI